MDAGGDKCAVQSGDSNLSMLSAKTCNVEFTDLAPLPSKGYKVRFSVSSDEHGPLTSEFCPGGGLRFHLPDVDVILAPPEHNEYGSLVRIFGEAQDPNLEWSYIMQMRFRTGGVEGEKERLVDSEVFQMGNRCPPIMLLVEDASVTKIRIEMRFVQKSHCYLPRFDAGDVTLYFGRQSLKVFKDLLALYSNYMAEKLRNVREFDIVDMGDCSIDDFKELLYQIYPTSRPISANFHALTRVANQFRVNCIINKISSHFLSSEHGCLEEKISEAIKLELPRVIEELVYKAEHDGKWDVMIRNGLNPEEEFGAGVYRHIILPAVAKAKGVLPGTPFYSSRVEETDFRDPNLAADPSNVPVIVQGNVLYVNSGLLIVHNDKCFGRGNNGELIVQITLELWNECYRVDSSPLDIFVALLRHIYPSKEAIPCDLLRAVLILARTHRFIYAMKSIEQSLVQEPPSSSAHFLEHFTLAEKYGFDNLLRMGLHRVETSCRNFVKDMMTLPGYSELQEKTRICILDRFCSGWGVGRMFPTKRLNRMVTINDGGVTKSVLDRDDKLGTFMVINSDEAFGGDS